MASNPSQPATRQYVDQSIDAQRQYAEKLFHDAEARVEYCFATWAASQERRLEAKLQAALEKIRPAPTVYPPCSPPDLPTAAAPAGLSAGWTTLTVTRANGRLRIQLR